VIENTTAFELWYSINHIEIEYEATFTNIDKDEIRNKLTEVGATLKRVEFTQKRTVFNLPKNNEIKGGWMRIRDEGDKITMSLKVVDGNNIEDQKEACVEVNNYKEAELILTTLGCERKAYQETKRELWVIDEVEITIDTWPFLESFIEVEGTSEEKVMSVSNKLEMSWDEAKFCAVDVLYSEKYGIPTHQINNETPEILFEMKNPFLK
jgi:adenylate cyclase class 2